MHGNVWEWCWDWYGEGYYNQPAADDPTGPAGAAFRVIHGGSWSGNPRGVRSAYHFWDSAVNRMGSVGFRLARGQAGR